MQRPRLPSSCQAIAGSSNTVSESGNYTRFGAVEIETSTGSITVNGAPHTVAFHKICVWVPNPFPPPPFIKICVWVPV